MRKCFYLLLITVILAGCSREKNACPAYTGKSFGFNIYEVIQDTILPTDTAFAGRPVYFKSNSDYQQINWTVGGDPRIFTTPTINLQFSSPTELNVRLKALDYLPTCTQQEFASQKHMVILPADGTVQSPLVGQYKGINQDKPHDSFTVSIKFWKGDRYPFWSTGAYSVENLPQGFVDSTQNFNGLLRPEVKGIIATTGYYNIGIDRSGNYPAQGIKGYGSLRRGASDSLIVNYTLMDTAWFTQTGQFRYFSKTFIGIKK